MSRPFFSIVMAIQNGFPYLPLAIESLREQTFADYELIVVDDHSTDGTVPYLQGLGEPRLRLLNSPFQGQTPALNVGLESATGAWIVRMDGDDWCDPRRLALQKAAIEASVKPPVLITSDYVICDEAMNPVSTMRLAPPNPRLRAYLETKNNPFCHPTVVFNRDISASVGHYDTTIRNAQDYRLWLKLLRHGDWVHVHEPLIKYRVRRGSLSVLYQPEQAEERKTILAASATPGTRLAAPPRAAAGGELEATYEYKLGFAAWAGGRFGDVWRHLTRSLTAGRSYRWKALALLALSLLPRPLRLRATGYAGVYQ